MSHDSLVAGPGSSNCFIHTVFQAFLPLLLIYVWLLWGPGGRIRCIDWSRLSGWAVSCTSIQKDSRARVGPRIVEIHRIATSFRN